MADNDPLAAPHPVPTGTVLTNAPTGRAYRLGKPLGAGGAGAAYIARQVLGRPRLRGTLCVKVSLRPEAWHREAYFGQLLAGVARAITIHDSFATFVKRAGTTIPLYCLVSELAARGDLEDYLSTGPKQWSEAKMCREIAHLLRVLIHLHDSGAVHRDLTPKNVFVTAEETLKLGDFGIARHRRGKRDVRADAFAPWFVATQMLVRAVRTWRPADDVYQMGLVTAALVSGFTYEKLTPEDVRGLPCSPWLKAVVQRAIGERRKRFPDAAAMLTALQRGKTPPMRTPRLVSLRKKVVVITGGLSISRREASRLAVSAGAVVRPKVGGDTDVVVVGSAAPDWKAEDKGQKLLDVDREAERGHIISVINERKFLAFTRARTTRR